MPIPTSTLLAKAYLNKLKNLKHQKHIGNLTIEQYQDKVKKLRLKYISARKKYNVEG